MGSWQVTPDLPSLLAKQPGVWKRSRLPLPWLPIDRQAAAMNGVLRYFLLAFTCIGVENRRIVSLRKSA